uniref:Uncharacterized protein n=1 Tax=Cannabis sativa TaxID=3483 RepID=A0A803P948_CANSA
MKLCTKVLRGQCLVDHASARYRLVDLVLSRSWPAYVGHKTGRGWAVSLLEVACPSSVIPFECQDFSAPPYDPHVAKVATMGRVRVVEEATQSRDDVDSKVGQGEPLNRLGQPLVIGMDHVLMQSSEPQVLDAGSQGDRWVSPASVIPTKTFNRILASGLVGHQWLGDTNNTPTSKVGGYAWNYFIAWDIHEIRHRCFQRVPIYKRSIPTLQMRDRANHILSLPVAKRNVIRLASVANFKKYGLYPTTFGDVGARGPSDGVDGASTDEEVCPSGGHVPHMDDDVPSFWIAWGLEKRERALRQLLAHGGTVGNATLRIRHGG